MPRVANQDSCLTCRRRKLKCDGASPACARCIKRGLHCDRTSGLKIKVDRRKKHSEVSEHQSPRQLLCDRHIAELFHIYIHELAPLYDLNDEDHAFASNAESCAFENPLLFSAMIASAAMLATRRRSSSMSIAEAYHSRCLKLLIGLDEKDIAVTNGIALAATCLLRLYEVLSEKEDPARHLFGASTLVPGPPLLSNHSLLASGFWNYLREDITYSLIHDCQLKLRFDHVEDRALRDDEKANQMTLLLARTIACYFGHGTDETNSEVDAWKHSCELKPFARFDERPFPIIHMFKGCQVAALQYYHVAKCMLQPENAAYHATEICGLAMTAKSVPVLVNSYGPICFSAQWLTSEAQCKSLVRWLRDTQDQTSWPVENLITRLQSSWTATEDGR